MEKIYRVKLNSKGMPNFSTAEEVPNGKWEEKETFSAADDRRDNDIGRPQDR